MSIVYGQGPLLLKILFYIFHRYSDSISEHYGNLRVRTWAVTYKKTIRWVDDAWHATGAKLEKGIPDLGRVEAERQRPELSNEVKVAVASFVEEVTAVTANEVLIQTKLRE